MDPMNVLDLADINRREIVPCFLGSPGIGKTQRVYQWAKDHDRNVVEIIASQCLPSEVAGTGMPDDETGTWKIYDPWRLTQMKDGDILFFDELLTADQSVLFACLTIIQERRLMSGHMLPDIIICAAANPISPQRIEDSIKQRFIFCPVNSNKNEWQQYMKEKYGQYKDFSKLAVNFDIPDIARSLSEWNLLTPRTITKLYDLIEKANDHGLLDTAKEFITLCFDKNITKYITEVLDQHDYNKEWNDFIDNLIDQGLVPEQDSDAEVKYSTMSLSELLTFLEGLPDWDKIAQELKNQQQFTEENLRKGGVKL